MQSMECGNCCCDLGVQINARLCKLINQNRSPLHMYRISKSDNVMKCLRHHRKAQHFFSGRCVQTVVQLCFCSSSVWLYSLDILFDCLCGKLSCLHLSLSLSLKKRNSRFVLGTKETKKKTCDLECRGGLQLANLIGSWIVLWIISSKCHWWSRAV